MFSFQESDEKIDTTHVCTVNMKLQTADYFTCRIAAFLFRVVMLSLANRLLAVA